MRGIVEKITWVIEVVNVEEIKARYAGFAIDHWMIMRLQVSFVESRKTENMKAVCYKMNKG